MSRTNPSRREVCSGIAAALLFLSTPRSAETAKHLNKITRYPDIIGELQHHVTKQEDTLLDLARINKLGYVEIVAANPGIDPWIPGDGTKVVLPTAHLIPAGPRQGLLLNLADQRLYYFPENGGLAESFPIGTGQDAWDTPLGETTVIQKKRNPTWFVPKSVQKDDPTLPAIVRPGPDNPLGRYAIYLGWQSYLIHGTNNPWGVGRRVSHGCVRMYPEDIQTLFPQIPVGTKVTVVSQEVKLGWHLGQLMLEVHPNLKQNYELEETGKLTPATIPEVAYHISQAAGELIDKVNWKVVNSIVKKRSGIPVSILH